MQHASYSISHDTSNEVVLARSHFHSPYCSTDSASLVPLRSSFIIDAWIMDETPTLQYVVLRVIKVLQELI